MTTIDATLRGAVAGTGEHLTLTLDPTFAGLPDTAHGGSVLALFDHLAARGGERRVHGRYLRRVPLGVSLDLTLRHSSEALACRVAERQGAVLVEGRVTAAEAATTSATPPPDHSAMPLPVSLTCFACGIENACGLRAELAFDDRTVGGAWTTRPAFRLGDGTLSPIVLTTLLDEAAFWLGALASGESGMTTDLAVTLHGAVPADGGVVVSGERAAVRRRTDDPRYWDTRVNALDTNGRLVASAAITFVAVRGAARRLVTGLLAMNPPDVVRRVFPAYCSP